MTKKLKFGQPPPKKSKSPKIWDVVIADMKRRKKEGEEKYGVALQAFNGRDALADAYEEALDLTVYLRQKIYEIDMGGSTEDEE